MESYWHGQRLYGPGRDGICQESCRDLGHVSLGYRDLDFNRHCKRNRGHVSLGYANRHPHPHAHPGELP